jgi:hypothetical protein
MVKHAMDAIINIAPRRLGDMFTPPSKCEIQLRSIPSGAEISA